MHSELETTGELALQLYRLATLLEQDSALFHMEEEIKRFLNRVQEAESGNSIGNS